MKKKIIIILLALVAIIVAIFGALAIYYKNQIANAPTMQELAEAYPWKVPDDWFQTDTITLKGRIEGYDAEKFGFTSMECSFNDVFESNQSTVLLLNIAEDGTFCKKFLASYPMQQVFYTTDSKVSFHRIPFFARPGETIDVTVRKGSFGRYECVYSDGSSKDVERWLRNWDELASSFSPLWQFEGTFEEANEVADMTWKIVMAKLQKLIRSEHFTPMEVQLALADAQARFGEDYLGCIVKQADALVNREKCDSLGRAEILDSTEWKKTTEALIALQKQWKEIGAVPRKRSEQLWKRFREACDTFFEARDKNAKPENDYYGNLKAKRALVEEIRAFELPEGGDALAAAQEFLSRWQSIGFVPFKEKENIQNAFSEAMQAKFPDFQIRGSRPSGGRGPAQRKPLSEKDRLVQEYNKLQQDIDTYENNIGFFSASKNSEPLIKQMQERIEAAKLELKALEEKIRQAEASEE